MAQFVESGTPINLTSTNTVSIVSGSLLGFYVNNTSSGTLVFRIGNAGAGGSAATVISGTITPAIGFHKYPVYCPSGLHATIGGTLDVTLSFAAG